MPRLHLQTLAGFAVLTFALLLLGLYAAGQWGPTFAFLRGGG